MAYGVRVVYTSIAQCMGVSGGGTQTSHTTIYVHLALKLGVYESSSTAYSIGLRANAMLVHACVASSATACVE